MKAFRFTARGTHATGAFKLSGEMKAADALEATQKAIACVKRSIGVVPEKVDVRLKYNLTKNSVVRSKKGPAAA